ncbi:MAG: PAS domain S-box protein [Planctomycetes bacterium]|nr:PAS domain S-box protein [Planctomycetota bacterium]
MKVKLRKTSIKAVGNVPWGTHFCQFYQTKEDLVDILVPYFKAGLEDNELCMWITAEPLNVAEAHKALQKKVKNLDSYIKKGQIEILEHSQWYSKSENIDPEAIIQGFINKEEYALKKGFDGLRITGNSSLLERKGQEKFSSYEEHANIIIANYKMLALCSYSLDNCSPSEIIDVVNNHEFTLIKQEGQWKTIQSSERKKAEDELRDSEERFRDFFENVPIGFHIFGPDRIITRINEVELAMIGYVRDEIVGKKTWSDLIIPEQRNKFEKHWHDIITKGKVRNLEYTLIHKEGRHINVILNASSRFDKNGNLINTRGSVLDITERKKAEGELRTSEERFRRSITESPFPIMIHADDGEVLQINKVWTDITGYTHEEIPTLSAWTERAYGERKDVVKNRIDKIFDSDTRVEGGEYFITSKDGKALIWDFSSAPLEILPDGRRLVISMAMDVTERKDIEAQQQLAGQILECLNRESVGADLIRDILKLVKKVTNFDAVGIRQHKGNDFPYLEVNGFPDDFVKAENHLCSRSEAGELVFDSKGRPILECMCGVVLSDRTDPSLPFFTEGGSFWTNSTTELLTGTPKEVFEVPTRNRCNKEGYESVALIPLRSGDEIVGLLQLNDTRKEKFTPEMVRFFEEIGASIGIGLARIRAEQEVEDQARFPSENPYPVLRIEKDGMVLYANAAGSELLGNWGRSVGTQAPEHWQKNILRTLESGQNESLEVTCQDRIFSLTIAPVKDSGYANLYGTDITERKQAEENLRNYRQQLEELVHIRTAELTETNKRLLLEIEGRKYLEKEILNISEREQKRIGQELHDSIGQQFTGIAFLTKVLEQKLTEKLPDEATDAAEIKKLVNQAMDQMRSLARGLHPVDLDAGSLTSALQELAAATGNLFGIRCIFKYDKPIMIDDVEVATHLYRITQEAITNAIKHGKTKNIHIELGQKRDNSVLKIKNDGLDFPTEFGARGTGMGLQIMDHRADIIGASLEIHKAAEGGTIVTCSFSNKTN